MKITDRIPPFKRHKPMWATRPRRFETLAILAGSTTAKALGGPDQQKGEPLTAARQKAFNHGLRQFLRQSARMRSKFTRFKTTPDWEGLRSAHLGAHEVLK